MSRNRQNPNLRFKQGLSHPLDEYRDFAFMDVALTDGRNRKQRGRIYYGLFDRTPNTSENFVQICRGKWYYMGSIGHHLGNNILIYVIHGLLSWIGQSITCIIPPSLFHHQQVPIIIHSFLLFPLFIYVLILFYSIRTHITKAYPVKSTQD